MPGHKKVLILFLSFIFLVPCTLIADDSEKEDYEWKTWRTKRSQAGFNGHGGVMFLVLPFECDELPTKEMGIDELPDVMLGFGGLGMGYVGKGWRIGGGGFGASVSSSGVVTDSTGNTFNRYLELSFGGGGVIVEYSPWMKKQINFGVGCLLGGGAYSVKFREDSGTFTWDDLSGQFITDPGDGNRPNVVTTIEQPVALFQPYATARFHLLDWIAVEGTVGMHITSTSISSWEFEDKEVSGDGIEITTKYPFYKAGVVFGG